MALTDQPYLPLYVDDWMNNNKLKMCTPEAHGIMISIMCIMHKEETYGRLLLKQKFKQTDKQTKNFALQLTKLCAFDLLEIELPFNELIENKILKIENDALICERMVKDAELSQKRAKSGRLGGFKRKNTSQKEAEKKKKFALAKGKANAVNGIVNENVIVNDIENVNEERKKGKITKVNFSQILDLYHRLCPKFPKVQVVSTSRKSSIKARIQEHGLNKISQVFELAGQSNFLNGQNKEQWRATFDWLMAPNNFVKVLEGNYQNKAWNPSQSFVSNRPSRHKTDGH